MNKLGIVKDIADIVVSIGVSSIVGNAIKLTTDPEAKLPKKIAIGIGGIVLSGLVSEAAQKYANVKIDNAAETVTTVVNNIKKAKVVVIDTVDQTEPETVDIPKPKAPKNNQNNTKE